MRASKILVTERQRILDKLGAELQDPQSRVPGGAKRESLEAGVLNKEQAAKLDMGPETIGAVGTAS
ncbi:hypothetical protein [Nannocystis pusilla]|uniref:hypothetical protein n=1 Tax=Nannocystis pusilla TaxID=889268 RepID=UPI003B7C8F08